jgi:tRNA A37 methylthiotransferase MiaB
MSFAGAAFGNDATSLAQRRARNHQKYLCHKLKAPKSTEAVWTSSGCAKRCSICMVHMLLSGHGDTHVLPAVL